MTVIGSSFKWCSRCNRYTDHLYYEEDGKVHKVCKNCRPLEARELSMERFNDL